MRVRLKGVNSRTKRLADGTLKTYYWAWKGGPALPGKPGSPEFVAAYNAAIARKVMPSAGVLLSLLNRFQDSGEFLHKISERTRRDYVKQMKRVERAFADFPIKALADREARAVFLEWRDDLARTSLRQADYAYGTLARILSWALKRGLIDVNPCAEGGKLYHSSRVEKIWSDEHVKPYIRRQKNDASDASAICEAVTRPSMRFVGVRSLENQATLMRHKTREMLVSQRTRLLNALRGHLTEVGVIAAQGPRHGRELAELIEACDETIPFEVCEALAPLVVQLRNLDEAIARLDRTIAKLAQKDETARRLMSIPGFGPITASAMAATIQDTSSFAGPREFAAFLGLTPKQNSSGGKPKLGRISKMGNRNLRKLLVVGAHAVLFHRKPHTDPLRMWAKRLLEKKPFKLVAVALANKMARIAFAILRGKTVYREIPA